MLGHSTPQRQDEEPPLTLRVSGLGEPLTVQEGEPFEVEIGGETVRLMVEVLGTRTLCTPEVCLDYPTSMGFEYDPSEGSETWTLDGNDATLQVQVNPISQRPQGFAKDYFGFLADLGDGEVLEEEPNELEVEGLRLRAFRAVMPWGELEFRCDLYAVLKDEEGRWATTFIILQEVADREEAEASEVGEARDLLARTLRAAR
ncbi:MAG: hypothetical protein ISQ08_04685 [Planctomycetes bacterium]|nr:hypothetical protein [Planctomycetota bacterium]